MNEQERQLIEAQQSCKRISCPHCCGTGQMTVASGPPVRHVGYNVFVETALQGGASNEFMQGLIPPH